MGKQNQKNQSMGETRSLVVSKLGSMLSILAMIQRYLPDLLHTLIDRVSRKLANLFYPYTEVRFFEYTGDYRIRDEAFSAIEHYLASKSSTQSSKLKGEVFQKSLVLKMDEQQEVYDNFKGIKLVWSLKKIVPKTQSVSFYPVDEKRYYLLTFHGRHRGLVTGSYLNHVLDEGKSMRLSKRQRRLYTNCAGEKWSPVIFEHPASFETLAMDPDKKKEIVDDLTTFREAKEYYTRVGKPWKRGYLLYGPPGTGKSTLVAAIANFMRYDIYDIELTNVKDNAELRKLLIGITAKSVVVIEDIDCTLDLTGRRKVDSESGKGKEKNAVTSVKKLAGSVGAAKKTKSSKVTLSGLLNFIDGIWSGSSGERLFIFTTNFVGKLDEALIRRGRMDMHIELSYCGFEGFKVLAKNYLNLESHPSFGTICCLLEETNMTPADVAENLMPKAANENTETSLERLIQALRSSKEKARTKAKKEQRNTKMEESLEEEKAADGKQEEEKAADDKQEVFMENTDHA